MHDTFVIKTDPEGKFAYTNINDFRKAECVIKYLQGIFSKQGMWKFGSFCFFKSCLSEIREKKKKEIRHWVHQQTTLVRKFVYID